MAKREPEPDPVRDMLRALGFDEDQIFLLMGNITPAQGRREGDRLYREYDAVVHFAEARKDAISDELSGIDHRQPPNDRPDALATCSRLGDVGIEVMDVRPMMSEEELERARAAGTDPMDAAAAVELIRGAIAAKEQKRQAEGWERPDNTILLIRVFQDIQAVGRELQKTNHDAFIPQNGFREIWIQDSEYSFAKDGEFLGSATICIHPADQWLKRSIYSVHRRVGLTNKDVYMPLEPPSKGQPLIAMWLPDPPQTK